MENHNGVPLRQKQTQSQRGPRKNQKEPYSCPSLSLILVLSMRKSSLIECSGALLVHDKEKESTFSQPHHHHHLVGCGVAL